MGRKSSGGTRGLTSAARLTKIATLLRNYPRLYSRGSLVPCYTSALTCGARQGVIGVLLLRVHLRLYRRGSPRGTTAE